jgi:uncharacterized protein YhaN
MFLVELVLQGVRGFQQPARVRFQGGFNFVAAGNEAGKTTCVDTILRLLYPVNHPAKMESLVSRTTPDASRGALVIFSDDSSYYQVIQDFSKKAVNLSKHDPATKKFTLQYKDWNATSQFLAGLLPGISEEDYNRLFLFRRESCAGQSPVEAAAAPQAARARHSAPAGRPASTDARLAELRETMRKAEEAADAEYKLEAAKLRLGEIAKKLESITEAGRRTGELEAELDRLKVCEMLPENLNDLIGEHEREQSAKMVKTEELAQDIEVLTSQRDAIPPSNMVMDKLFIAGVAVLGLALVTGLFVPIEGADVYFPIGVLAAVLLIAAGWYNSSRKNVQRTHVQREIDGLVKERAEIEKKFQDSGAAIMKYMKTTDAKSVAELKEKAESYRHFQSLYRDVQEHQQLMQGSVNADDLQIEYAKQQAEVEVLAEAARAVAHNAVDTYSVRQEIERIEAEHAPASQDLGFGGMDMGAEFAPSMPQPPSGPGLNVLAEIAVASRVSGIEMETLVPAVESAAQRNLTALSAAKYVRVEVGPDGLPVVQDRSGAKHLYGNLSHGMREAVCFCLRAALVEAIAGKRRLPFVLDDPFAGLDPARQQAGCQLLRVLGTKTQVIMFSSNPALKAANDVATELK